MATKRTSPRAKTRRKTTTVAAELTNGAVMDVLESAAGSRALDPDARRRLVAAEAYFLAERRGFAPGNELGDWVAAEHVVDSRFQHSKVA
jgi:Protein of unknown function (DUF2934)